MNKEPLRFTKPEDMQKYLYDTYPTIFEDHTKSMSETCMCWGICCDVGWFNILDTLCKKADVIAKTVGIQLIADQVKEKFGTLRWYWHTRLLDDVAITYDEETGGIWYSIIESIVNEAENKSYTTCELCGNTWGARTCSANGWLQTLCKECATKSGKYVYPEEKE